jgi:magnesium-transporting ATPase (P-type)
MKQISKIVIIFGIVSSIFFIAYFVVQLIMFSNAETAIKNNSKPAAACNL